MVILKYASENLTMILKGLLSRLIFFAHAGLAIHCLHGASPNAKTHECPVWYLFIPIGLLVIETIVTVFYRKGMEYTYVWPGGFLYISSIIPIIWITELRLLEQRIEVGKQNTSFYTSGLYYTSKNAGSVLMTDQFVGKKICELGLIIGLILGRWLMPRGKMSRDQLSALLLGYVGNSADILELFDSFQVPKDSTDDESQRYITISIIAVYTWSLYQFSLVTTATMRNNYSFKSDIDHPWLQRHNNNINRIEPTFRTNTLTGEGELDSDYINALRAKNSLLTEASRQQRGKGKKHLPPPTHDHRGSTDQEKHTYTRRKLHGEVFQIVVSIAMQDGPFLVARLYLMTVFHINNEMYIFFMCKNAVMVILLIYRLLILSCRGNDEEIDLRRETASVKLNNTQVATVAEHCNINDKNLYTRSPSQDPAIRNRAGSRGYHNFTDRNHSLKNEELLNKKPKTLKRDVEKKIVPVIRMTGPKRGMKTLPTISKLIKMDELLLDDENSTNSSTVPEIVIGGEVDRDMGPNDTKDISATENCSNFDNHSQAEYEVSIINKGFDPDVGITFVPVNNPAQISTTNEKPSMLDNSESPNENNEHFTPPSDGDGTILNLSGETNPTEKNMDNSKNEDNTFLIPLNGNIEINLTPNDINSTQSNNHIYQPTINVTHNANNITQNAMQGEEEYEHSIASHVTARDITLQVTNKDIVIEAL